MGIAHGTDSCSFRREFINELKNLDIVGKLNREANADPNHNYEILIQSRI